ncbi:MAG TPA: M20/M25/M40 family metallo-hydrolase [Chloroflexota bacterium]|nr:M20/M25/M40 family metallo-hydrolase [Chloroflexota bacterium]
MSGVDGANDAAALQLLAALGEIPTAPLHELKVAAYVAGYLQAIGVPFQVDPYGNVIATLGQSQSVPPVAFAAHLDHPAFEISAVGSGRTARALLLGGVSVDCFHRPVPVLVYPNAHPVNATIIGAERDVPVSGSVTLILEVEDVVQVGDYGVFDLPPFQQEGETVSMRAADDLAGVAAALAALKELARSPVPGQVFGVFTRAEEVGLVGAALVAQQRILPPRTIVISLECSRELPGAQPGLGPVIRVGDRTRSFDPVGEALLLAARDRLADTPVQRQLMSGGTCEATAYAFAGYAATGVALPLVNYHNVGPDDSIAQEQINARDYLGEIKILVAAAHAAGVAVEPSSKARIAARVDQYQARLRASAPDFQQL